MGLSFSKFENSKIMIMFSSCIHVACNGGLRNRLLSLVTHRGGEAAVGERLWASSCRESAVKHKEPMRQRARL